MGKYLTPYSCPACNTDFTKVVASSGRAIELYVEADDTGRIYSIGDPSQPGSYDIHICADRPWRKSVSTSSGGLE